MKVGSEIDILLELLLLVSFIPLSWLKPVPHRTRREIEVEIEEEEDIIKPIVFLTVSSLASSNEVERLLELNWYNVSEDLNQNEDSSVRLFSHDPQDNISDYLVSIHPRDHEHNYYRTSIQFPKYSFQKENMTNACLGFWIAFVSNESALAKSCIRAYPNWMYEMKDIIGNKKLGNLMIPGTHNAGTYADFDPDDDHVLNRYLITQDESVWNQLVYGIRYLDLRVSYERDNGDKFWITHGPFRTDTTVNEIIEQVKEFLKATKEIVIMDFHRFVNGFSGRRAAARHRSLIQILERELGEYIIPASMTSSADLNSLWEADKRLYIGYAWNAERARSNSLFPAVKHLWAETDKISNLFDYLARSVCDNHQGRLTSSMAQLTPTTAGAIFDTYGGLRKMGHEVNPQITRWFHDLWWNCANIVSTDFFLGNDIIQTSIEANKKKFTR